MMGICVRVYLALSAWLPVSPPDFGLGILKDGAALNTDQAFHLHLCSPCKDYFLGS